jgi:D-alanyl-D-alanine carboxypeptidase
MLTAGATVRRTLRGDAIFTFSLAIAAASIVAACLLASPAEARRWSHAHHFTRHAPRHFARVRHRTHSVRYMRERPFAAGRNFAAIVVDGNSGQTLYASAEDEPRHPASITKVMTLYLLFEQLEQGRWRLDSELRVSAHAAAQKPTKLGLKPGQTIRVEDAIKAVVTRSANDMAVAIAEAIGGDEDHFADLMTRKAHELGMAHTRYVNASGLPDDAQITTARDLSILGRAVQERFPRYYPYFSTRAFYYAGATILNHNHLMDRVEGMDGIKTGYTRASGFNLLTSVRRDGRYIVAVVMGGVSAPSRDRIMANLIEDQIERGAPIRTAAAIPDLPPRPQPKEAETDLPRRPPAQQDAQRKPQPAPEAALAFAETAARADVNPASKLALSASAPKPAPPLDPIRVASIAPEAPVDKPRPAYVSATVKQLLPPDAPPTIKRAAVKPAALDGSTNHAAYFAPPTAAPSTMRWTTGPAPAKIGKFEKPLEQTTALKRELASADKGDFSDAKIVDAGRPAEARVGWMIQIGATDDVVKANALLARAKADGRAVLSAAHPFTEKVQKGAETLYRARFAGLEADSAELACKTLKRSGFSCFATKN